MEIEKNDPSEILREVEEEKDELEEVRESLFDSCTTKKGIDWDKLNYLLSQEIIKRFNLFTFSDNEDIYIYNNGVYESGERRISEFLQMFLLQYAKLHRINEILGHIRRQTYKKRSDVEEEKDRICLANGILNLNTLEITKHSPEYIFYSRVPIFYEPHLDCPIIKQFISEIVNEEDIDILQEITGYLLYKRYFVHKAIMFVGAGANGKSTFINLMKSFMGFENCVSIPLHQLEEDKFALSSLQYKLANLFADLPSRALRNTSIFKMLVGEDLIPAEKKFKNKFFFTNYSKQIFSANQVPKSPDDSDAFFRRWVIINFPNQFVNSKADKGLLSKLTTEKELSGFLNFALEGLRRLKQQQDFSHTNSVNEVRDNYIRLSDSVGAFIMDCIEISPEGDEVKKELYTCYADYCRDHKYPIVPENTFHRELQKQVRVEDYKPLRGGQRITCWRGIKYNYIEKSPDNIDQILNLDKDINDVNPKTPIKLSLEDYGK